jgi:hypothetical protein
MIRYYDEKLQLPACGLVHTVTRWRQSIQDLHLDGCSYHVSSLPLLGGGLEAVEKLVLQSGDWEWEDRSEHAFMKVVVEAAFLALTAPSTSHGATRCDGSDTEADDEALYECKAALPLPQLKTLTIYRHDSSTDGEWLREALAAATVELGRRRPAPAELTVH